MSEVVKVSKSAAVREFKKANKAAKPQEIAGALVAQGIAVTPAFVSTILSAAKRKRASKRRNITQVVVRSASNGSVAVKSDSPDFQCLVQAKHLANELGGIERAKEALEALSAILAS